MAFQRKYIYNFIPNFINIAVFLFMRLDHFAEY
ncbi:MAG: hypothetical protein JWR54_3196 [Mucilaginibacter sp.]|nr:hypothetical protein [Mucilaginibacter sp.]